MREMAEHKPSQADDAHIVTAAYRREQNAGLERMAKLKALRLAQEGKAATPKPRRKQKVPVALKRLTRKRRWGG